MTAQELKNSILMQAVQGKLVPQDPNDEPASVLLAKIRAEKEQMMKEGKIKKEPISEIYVDPSDNQHYEKVGKSVKCIEDEIPFKLPNGWSWCRLNALGEIVGGGTPKTNVPENWNGTIPWLTPADMKLITSKYASKGERSISETGLNSSSAKLMPKNTILYSSRAPIGYIAIAANEICTNQGFKSLVPINNKMVDYIYYCLQQRTNDIKKRASGTTFKEISGKEFGYTLIPLPPLNEQIRITGKIEKLIPKVRRYSSLKLKTDELQNRTPNLLKKSILQYAIQGKLVKQNPDDEPASELIKRIRLEKEKLIKSGKLKKDKNESYIYRGSDNSYYEKFQNGKEICIDDEIPFEIPKGWEWIRINNCADIYTGNSISESVKKSRYTGLTDGLNYIGTKDVNFDNTINYNNGIKIPLGEPKFKKAYKNNTLICVEGGSAGRKVAILSENVCFGNKLATINSWTIDPMYIYLLFQSSIVQEFFKNNMTGIIGGVSVNKLKKLLIPVPPLNEQVRIVSTIKQIFEHL